MIKVFSVSMFSSTNTAVEFIDNQSVWLGVFIEIDFPMKSFSSAPDVIIEPSWSKSAEAS